MILTDTEMRQLQTVIESYSGFDKELLHRCGTLIHMGKFDEAVRSAFVLLEERLRKIVNQDGMTGTNLANYAFSKTGPLTKMLAHTDSERDGLRELYASAFKLFRNPAAHGATAYSPSKGKAILSLVNLLLLLLENVESLPTSAPFPNHIEQVLNLVETHTNPAVSSRLRLFLNKCRQLEIEAPKTKSKYWMPFKRYALQKLEGWEEARSHPLTLFYLMADDKNPALWVPVNQYYSRVIGLELESIGQQLRQLGFKPTTKWRDFKLEFQERHDQAFFDALYDLFVQIVQQLK